MPPTRPKSKKKFGGYCFRATCVVTDSELGCPIAKVKGYDKAPTIGKDTEFACKQHLRTANGEHRVCGDAEVVMLPSFDMECSGEVFWVEQGSVRRLV